MPGSRKSTLICYRRHSSTVIRKKTIFEYHKIDLKDKMIGNSSAILIEALPTCLMYTTCTECVEAKILAFEVREMEKIGVEF